MKKLLGKLVLIGLFTTAYYQANATMTCPECKACRGSYIICSGSESSFVADYHSNCGTNSRVTVDVIDC